MCLQLSEAVVNQIRLAGRQDENEKRELARAHSGHVNIWDEELEAVGCAILYERNTSSADPMRRNTGSYCLCSARVYLCVQRHGANSADPSTGACLHSFMC